MCADCLLRRCFRTVLALLLLACAAQVALAEMVFVPGTLYDRNKYFRGDMPNHTGGNSGWFADNNGNGMYDPGEPYGDSKGGRTGSSSPT